MASDSGDFPTLRVGNGAAGPVVAIVGAGFSGTMAAIHLRHALPPEFTVYLFDKTGRFARGPAYAASGAPHLLNVRSVNMSAFADDPGHFERWIDLQGPQATGEVSETEAGRFATRRLYGRYLRALLYEEMRLSGSRVRLASHEIVDALRTADGWQVRCASGRVIDVQGLVLAVGTLPSTRGQEGVVFHNPWADEATLNLRPDLPVLIMGSSLTMVDLALAMRARGFSGPIIAVSRRGLGPQPHQPVPRAWPAPDFTERERTSLSALLQRVRAEIVAAAAQGVGWRAVIDGLRPVTSPLWQALPPAEQARFLRHLRPYWDVHRHRMAPSAALQLDAMRQDGSLRLLRGHLHGITPTEGGASVAIFNRDTRQIETIEVQRVIQATGLGAADIDSGLANRLREHGLVRPDPLGVGLDVTRSLEVIGQDGRSTPSLWALGPIVRGVFWECTAVPDIRIQAALVAKTVAGSMTSYAAV